MTLKEIRAMFKAGDTWIGHNTLHEKANGPRTLIKLNSVEWIWSTPEMPRFHTRFPKASQIIEAEDGYIKLYVWDKEYEHTLTLKKEDT